jgi:hypothetical protein
MVILKTITAAVVFFSLYNQVVLAETIPSSSKADELGFSKLIEPDKLKEDLDFLFKTIEEVHPNMYAYTSKEEFSPIREKLYSQIDRTMTRLEFYKLTAPVVAAIRNSHTVLRPFVEEYKRYLEGGGKVFPLELRSDGSKVILSENYSATLLPVDGEVLAINARLVREIFASFSRLFSAESRNINSRLITEMTVLLRWLLVLEYGPLESWDLKIRSSDGNVNGYTIKSVAATELGGQESKATLTPNSYQHLPEYNTSLLEIKSFGGWGGDLEEFKAFLSDSFQRIRQQKVANLIIDIRDNKGGGDNLVHSLMEYLTAKPYRLYEKTEIKISAQSRAVIEHIRRQVPDKFANKEEGDIVTLEMLLRTPPANPIRFTGRVFVLIGSQTWSASTVFASAVKYFHVGTLVGEETPDPPTLYGSSIMLKMPSSQLQFAVASKLLVCAGGKPDGRGVLPDHEVKQKLQDTRNGIDTALQFTLDLIEEK